MTTKAAAGPAGQTPAAQNRNEARLRRLLERLPAAAYTCDADGLITYYNQRAIDLWGRAPRLNDPADRFCGALKLFAEDGAPLPHDRCWMAIAIRENRSFNGEEIVIERPDGRRVTALAHANPVHDKAGRLIGGVNVLVDISDRQRREDALKAADQSKNEFIATVAHELRNPLAPIRNVVELLQMHGNAPQDLSWALEVLERQVRQMTRLIDDLLDFARVTIQKIDLHREPTELADVLRAAVETSRPVIAEAGHELIFDAPVSLPVDCDRMRLAQVVSNLLNNAAKYTPRGGRIWLTARRDGDRAVISVRDTGVGIETETLGRIFRMFAQGSAAAQRTGDNGLGIGLALARSLVERHGGTLEAHSAGVNQGSEFIVRLPAQAQVEPGIALVPRTRSLRILIVDRSRTAAANLRALLQLLGHRVREARGAEHGLQLAEALHPDVVLADLSAPASGGIDLAGGLRGKQAAPLVLAVLDHEGDADLVRLRAAGFDDYLVRPIDPRALVTALAKLPPRPPDAKTGNGHWHHPEQTQILTLPLGPR